MQTAENAGMKQAHSYRPRNSTGTMHVNLTLPQLGFFSAHHVYTHNEGSMVKVLRRKGKTWRSRTIEQNPRDCRTSETCHSLCVHTCMGCGFIRLSSGTGRLGPF